MTGIYKITDYGVKKDCKDLQTREIQSVFDLCKKSGGTVIIPCGTYYTGALRMWSDTTLILENGSELIGSDICEDYEVFPIPPEAQMRSDMEMITSYYGKPWDTYRRAIISVYGGKNIKITGQGVIDGNDCADPEGEEGYRGPHGIFITSVDGVELSDYTIRSCGNFMHEINNSKNIHINKISLKKG